MHPARPRLDDSPPAACAYVPALRGATCGVPEHCRTLPSSAPDPALRRHSALGDSCGTAAPAPHRPGWGWEWRRGTRRERGPPLLTSQELTPQPQEPARACACHCHLWGHSGTDNMDSGGQGWHLSSRWGWSPKVGNHVVRRGQASTRPPEAAQLTTPRATCQEAESPGTGPGTKGAQETQQPRWLPSALCAWYVGLDELGVQFNQEARTPVPANPGPVCTAKT